MNCGSLEQLHFDEAIGILRLENINVAHNDLSRIAIVVVAEEVQLRMVPADAETLKDYAKSKALCRIMSLQTEDSHADYEEFLRHHPQIWVTEDWRGGFE
ncbi:MAG: hypothetical protein WBD20_04135 [Pirellulaceae bacterium]